MISAALLLRYFYGFVVRLRSKRDGLLISEILLLDQ